MIKELQNVKKIAILMVSQLGDMLCVIPAVRALKFDNPGAEITLLGLPWAQSFVERFSNYFDKFIDFKVTYNFTAALFHDEKFEIFLENIRKEKFDLLIQMQGNGTFVNMQTFDFGAANIAGFYEEGSIVDSPWFVPYPGYGSEIHRYLLLMKHLGIESSGDHLEFPLTKQDLKDFNQLSLPINYQNYICIHPGAGSSRHQWPPQYFAAVADYCADNGFIVIITGTNEERDTTKEVIKRMHHYAIDLTGITSVGAMAVLIKNAFAIISNLTAISQVADALDTPSVIISMNNEPERWAPLDTKLHRVIDWTQHHFFETVLLETDSLIRNLLMHEFKLK